MNIQMITDNHESEQAFHTIDRMKEWRNKFKFNDRKYEFWIRLAWPVRWTNTQFCETLSIFNPTISGGQRAATPAP